MEPEVKPDDVVSVSLAVEMTPGGLYTHSMIDSAEEVERIVEAMRAEGRRMEIIYGPPRTGEGESNIESIIVHRSRGWTSKSRK